ncbi:MAG: hypothetical protein C4582_10795 [Desulfobacteraceae bacterium]|jgi:type IV pilus assembly protein PilP|nr:MAG: hypothetical protein C4582_10795 [Desulfobacteraceae bacterium]
MKSRLKRKNSFLCVSIALLAFLCVAAAPEDPLKVIYKGPRGPRELPLEPGKEPAAQTKQAARYRYNPEGKVDPFKSFLTVKEIIPQAGEEGRPKTYLETLDLSQLDLIAIVVSPKGSWAMVRDAKGLGYPVVEGTPIGLHGGVILSISDGKIIVREKYRDFRGKVVTRDVEKKLYRE